MDEYSRKQGDPTSDEEMQRRQLVLACAVPFVSMLIEAWQETLNFWKQINHVMKFFREEETPDARLPANFMQGFLEVGTTNIHLTELRVADSPLGA